MRRLAAIALLASTLIAPPAGAERERPSRAPRPTVSASFATPSAGAIRLGPVPDAEWPASQHAAVTATGRIPRELTELLGTARASAVGPSEYDLYTVFPVGDLDGDRVRDLVFYRTRFTMTDLGPVGRLDLAAYSGKSGALRWRRGFPDSAAAAVFDAPVGPKGRRGLLLLDISQPSEEHRAIRIAGLNGTDGRTAYDRTVSTEDGKGGVALGGIFDAYPGAGIDVLLSRVQEVLAIPPAGLSLFVGTPYILDGADGTLREGHDPVTEVTSRMAFVASGDHDGDRRDDFLKLTSGITGDGRITAYSAVENRTLWERDGLPVIGVMDVKPADVTGGREEDLVLTVWDRGGGLLKIPGVTDGLPLLDGPDPATRGLVLDGPTGNVVWDRVDGPHIGHYFVQPDLNRDGKSDVLFLGLLVGQRDGLRVRVIDGKNRVLRKRDVTVEPPVGRTGMGAASALGDGLDMDGDGIGDLWYQIESYSPVQKRRTSGFLLMKPNRLVTTTVEPFWSTLDGRSTERVSVRHANGRATWTIADGLRGPAYWTVSGRADASRQFGVAPFPNARGRCADLMLLGHAKGAFWIDVAHGSTGRIRWSRTLLGKRPVATKLQVRRGAPVVCR